MAFIEIISKSYTDTEAAGRVLAGRLQPGSVVAMYGDLGAGKTAFVRGMGAGLGHTGVKSPTYTIVDEHIGGTMPLFHFDMYRLGGEDELFDIGWEDYLTRGGICAVEWSENVPGALPSDSVKVRIEKIPGEDESRKIILEGVQW